MNRILTVLCLALILLCPQPTIALDAIVNTPTAFILQAPALDDTDGKTPETALTMTSWTIKAYKRNRAPVTVTAALAVFASSTLTSTGTAPANNDTVTFGATIDGVAVTETYTFKTTLTGAANEIHIGTAAQCLDYLKCAVNDSGCTEGTDYGTGTVASILVNGTTNTDTTQVFVANIPGTVGNAYTTTDSGSQLSFTGGTLSGGVDGMIHDANGYHWFCAPGSLFDVMGDMLITFNYTGVLPFWQKVKVVGLSSYEANVLGDTATVQGIYDLSAATAGQTAGSIGELFVQNIDATISSRLAQTNVVTVPKNTAYDNFTFTMKDASTGLNLVTGLTVSCQVSKDGGTLASCTNSVSEVGSGVYKTNIAAADLNADETYFIFTASGARRLEFKIRTQR